MNPVLTSVLKGRRLKPIPHDELKRLETNVEMKSSTPRKVHKKD